MLSMREYNEDAIILSLVEGFETPKRQIMVNEVLKGQAKIIGSFTGNF